MLFLQNVRSTWQKVLAFCLSLILVITAFPLFTVPTLAASTEDGFVYFINNETEMPTGFVNVVDYIPDAILDIRYYNGDNFVGVRLDGYEAATAILTKEAAIALKKAADNLREQGYLIKIFDAYRPRAAVKHVLRWIDSPEDYVTKDNFYPRISRKGITNGYFSPGSCCVHSRGSTIDLTLVHIDTDEEVDMGTTFDFFDTSSHHGTSQITKEQANNRQILYKEMTRAGFEGLSTEWWHFKLAREPYPQTYFTFYIKKNKSEVETTAEDIEDDEIENAEDLKTETADKEVIDSEESEIELPTTTKENSESSQDDD